jgi:hypothetical protein
MKIGAIIIRIKKAFIFKLMSPVHLFKLIVFLIFSYYKHIYANIAILIKLIISLIYYYIYNNKFIYKIISYIREEILLFDERGYRFDILKC